MTERGGAGAALARWAAGAQAAGPRLVAVLLAATLAVGCFAATRLGVNADNRRLLDPDLPFQRDARAFEERFPGLTESLLVVVDGETAELARDAVLALAGELGGRRDVFRAVFVPGSEPFFEERGLLLRSAEELEEFGDHLARLQPLLAELSRDPSLPTLTRLIRRGLEEADSTAVDWPAVLDGFRGATVEVYAEHPIAVSWEELLLEGSALDTRRRRVLVAEPHLDYGRLLPARPAIGAVREAAARLELTPERGVRLRVTGYPALNHEEMLGFVADIGVAGVISFSCVALVLVLALGWGRFVAAAALTLGVGLVWTAAFAAVAVGQLNLVSIAFAVLFIGLGVDFAIHLGLHLVAESRAEPSASRALARATRDVGGALLLCTFTTAIGFWSFVPTDYRGVGELGLIAGTGIFVIFALTLTLLPALLGSRRPTRVRDAGAAEASLRAAVTHFAERRAGWVLVASAVAVAAAVVLAPGARFDSNVVSMRDPSTESVQAFEDLLDGRATPWTVEVLAEGPEDAERRARRLESLEGVKATRTLADYLPSDQEEKLEILADLAFLFEVPPAPRVREAPEPAVQIAALRDLAAALDAAAVTGDSNLSRSARRLREELASFLEGDDGGAGAARADDLARLEELLLAGFPDRMERLGRALAAEPVTPADLPDSLVSRLRASDGTERIQVFPREDLRDAEALARFVAEVRGLEAAATGLPVNIVEFGRYTSASLRQAFAFALVGIAVLLLLLWRRVSDAALALAPVVAAALLTVGTMALLDRPFNFANVIVLPLLLGVGVDSGVHLVRRARRATTPDLALGDTATARGVFYSAVSTLVSFGSLALASHRGLSSLGVLLVIGMLWTLVCNLVMLPALLVWAGPGTGAPGAAPADPELE